MSWDWTFQQYIRKHLAQVTLGRHRKLAISIPPQHGKTSLVTNPYPVWRMAREPGLRVAIGAYSQMYANLLSRKSRRIARDSGLSLGEKNMANEWELSNGSSLYAVGVGTGIAGRSVDLCLASGTKIHTTLGLMSIEDVINMENRPNVLSYNHLVGRLEYRKILASSVSYADRFVELRAKDGNVVRCTRDHRVFTREHGYRHAEDIVPGCTVVSVREEDMPVVLGCSLPREQDVLRLLHEDSVSCEIENRLRSVLDADREEQVQYQEALQKRSQKILLLSRMLSFVPKKQSRQKMCTVRRSDWQEDKEILQYVQESTSVAGKNKTPFVRAMSALFNEFFSENNESNVLLQELCEPGSFVSNERIDQLQLQRWNELCETVSRYEENSTEERLEHVYRMWENWIDNEVQQMRINNKENGCGCPSHRWRCEEQQHLQSCDAMQSMSQENSFKVVSDQQILSSRRIHSVLQPVYDIQVEGNNNFFANNILVHNCIIDDPTKNREEADSVAHRERIWEWYMDDITTRLQEKSSIVIIMTRWREDDLVGRILNSDDAKNWQYVRLPAIAEDRDPLGRSAGEPLCPQRFTLDTLLERKKILGEGFEGLYQQNPVPRGGLFFKRDWFTSFVDGIAPTPKIRRLRYWDLAATTRDTSAYTAGVLMAYDGSRYYVEHIIRDRLNPADRNELIRKTAELDAHRPGFERTWFEEQPGAAGIEVSQSIIKLLAGLPCRGDRVTGSKETRAEPVADAARAGLISIVRGGWNEQFLSELASFPRGSYKDQVDSFAGAYAKLARGELAFAVATTR